MGTVQTKTNPIVRILFIIGGLMLINPSVKTDGVGIVLIVGLFLFQKSLAKKEQQLNNGIEIY